MPFPHAGEVFSVCAALLWALAVVLFKRSGEHMSPLALNLFKNVVGCLLYLLTMLVLGRTLLPPVAGRDYLLLAISGVIGLSVADTLFLRCLNIVGAGTSQIIACLYSPSVIVLSTLFLGERLTGGDAIGTGLILGGVLLTYSPAPGRDPSKHIPRGKRLEGILIGAVSFALMALGVVVAKPALENTPLLWATSYRLVTGTIALTVIGAWQPAASGFWRSMRPSGAYFTSLPAAVIGTYLAMIAWLSGVKYTTASAAAVLNQTSALFVLPIAAILLREPVTRRKVLALAMALAGVVIVTLR